MRYSVLLVLSLFVIHVNGQELIYNAFTTQEGLPGNEVFDLLTDDNGFIWGGTDGGVFCYNGNQFINYTTENGLSDNSVLKIYQDPIGRIWLSCFNGTVSCIYHHQVFQLPCNKDIQNLLHGNIVYAMSTDQNGDLLLASKLGCIIVSAESQFTEAKFESDEILNVDPNIRFTFKKLNGKIFSFPSRNPTLSETFELVFNNDSVYYNLLESSHVSSLSIIPNAIINSEKVLLFSYKNVLFSLQNSSVSVAFRSENIVNELVAFGDELWLGTANAGIVVLNEKTFHYKNDFLNGNSISSFTKDLEGGIWIGTVGSGLLYCPNSSIFNYQQQSKPERIVTLEIFDSSIYAITEKSSLINYDLNPFAIKSITPPEKNRTDFANLFYKDEQLYFSGEKSGIYSITKQTTYFSNNTKKIISSTDVIQHQNKIYLASYENILELNDDESILLPSPARTRCLYSWNDTLLLIGTLDGIYSFKNDTITPFLNSIFEDVRINEMDEWNSNLIVNTGSKGVYIIKPDLGVLYHFNESVGLVSNSCNQTVFCNNKFWICSKKGLSQIEVNEDSNTIISVLNFNHTDGLPTDEIQSLVYFNDDLFLATPLGLSRISQPSTLSNNFMPEVFIDSIYINEKKIQLSNQINLSHTQNNLTIFWSSNAFRYGPLKGCWYQLINYDQSPRFTKDSKIVYENLPTGQFQLQLTCSNNQGIKGNPSIPINFVIEPPFWQRFLFWIPIAILILLLTYLIFKWRVSKIRKQQQEKLEIERQINQLRMMATRAQMNPHFIFNAINGIQRFILEKKTDEAYHYLTRFSKLIRIVLENSSENMHTLQQELDIIKLYVELEQLRFENKFEFEILVDPKVNTESCLIPSLLLQPIIENSIWHGLIPLKKTRNGKLKLEITSDTNLLQIIISDNGLGHDKNQPLASVSKKKSMGLQLVQDRLKFLAPGSQFHISFNQSSQEQGTCVTLVIPIIHEND